MHFIPGNLYKHLTSVDVYYHVEKIQFRGPKYWKIKVRYVNRWTMKWRGLVAATIATETVRIRKEDFDHWYIIPKSEWEYYK